MLEMAEKEDAKLSKVSDFLFRFLIYPKVPISIQHKRPSHDLIYDDVSQCLYYSQRFHSIVKLYCSEFHGLFENFLNTRLTFPCKSPLQFVSYAVSNCRDFLNRDFRFLKNQIGDRNTNYVFLIMSYAMIAELLHFFLKRKCYKYLPYGAKAFTVVYERYLKKNFLVFDGWEGLKAYCDKSYEEYENVNLKNKRNASIVAIQTHEAYVVEIRKRLEYSVNYFNGKNILTHEEINQIGDFVIGDDPSYIYSRKTCRICGFDCSGSSLLYYNSYLYQRLVH